MTAKQLWTQLEESGECYIDSAHEKLVPKNKVKLKNGQQVHSIHIDKDGNYYIETADPYQFSYVDYSVYGTPRCIWVA